MPDRIQRPRRLPWMRDAACLEHPQDWWFVGEGKSAKPAKNVCRRCLVRAECLAYAIQNNEQHGIWGGFANHELKPWRKPQLCPGCHQVISATEVAGFILKGTARIQWTCRRCRYREIQSRRRA